MREPCDWRHPVRGSRARRRRLGTRNRCEVPRALYCPPCDASSDEPITRKAKILRSRARFPQERTMSWHFGASRTLVAQARTRSVPLQLDLERPAAAVGGLLQIPVRGPLLIERSSTCLQLAEPARLGRSRALQQGHEGGLRDDLAERADAQTRCHRAVSPGAAAMARIRFRARRRRPARGRSNTLPGAASWRSRSRGRRPRPQVGAPEARPRGAPLRLVSLGAPARHRSLDGCAECGGAHPRGSRR